MFERLGKFLVRRRRPVVAATVVFFFVAGALGAGVADRLSSGGFQNPDAETVRAAEALQAEFGQQTPNLILLVTSKTGSVDDPEATKAGLALSEELEAAEGVEQVFSYWSADAAPLKSHDGSQAMIFGVISGKDDVVMDTVEHVTPAFTRNDDVLDVRVTGFAEVFHEMGETIEKDLVKAESIAVPITLIALIFVFGSLVAASLPLLIGILSIVGSFLVLSVIASITQVSIFALNLTTALGLGLAIDYSLFVVSRYRELRTGLEPHEAVVRTVRTAGRTVAFSGLTVALSLAALLVFPMAFLRSFAYAGVAVVLLAATFATIFLPALLAIMGRKVDSLRLWKRKPKEVGQGFWHRLAMTVMRRPLPVATVVVLFLLFLGAPFLGVKWGQADDRALPASASSRQGLEQIRQNFDINGANALSVVAAGAGEVASDEKVTGEYAAALSRLPGTYAVQASTGTYVGGQPVLPPDESSARFLNQKGGVWFSVIPAVEAYSQEGEDLVHAIRDMEAPFSVLVGGASADLVDSTEAVFEQIPLAAGIIAVTTFILLFLMFGGLLVPVKAIILNLLSLTATFGSIVWIFQSGNLSGFLDFTPTGIVEITTPILMFCIAFGLSMDYEVFLLSRIKEEHDRTGDNTASVAIGLEHTGRIVTAAALLLSIVFVAFAASGVTFIKMFGIGLTIAIVMDATLIRGTLVPAFMRLAGEANWWAPRWMRKLHERFGISESGGEEAPTLGSPQPLQG